MLEIAKELRRDVSDALKKPLLMQTILAVGADDYKLSECIQLINQRETTSQAAEEESAEKKRKLE